MTAPRHSGVLMPSGEPGFTSASLSFATASELARIRSLALAAGWFRRQSARSVDILPGLRCLWMAAAGRLMRLRPGSVISESCVPDCSGGTLTRHIGKHGETCRVAAAKRTETIQSHVRREGSTCRLHSQFRRGSPAAGYQANCVAARAKGRVEDGVK